MLKDEEIWEYEHIKAVEDQVVLHATSMEYVRGLDCRRSEEPGLNVYLLQSLFHDRALLQLHGRLNRHGIHFGARGSTGGLFYAESAFPLFDKKGQLKFMQKIVELNKELFLENMLK